MRLAELCAGYSGLWLAMKAAGWPVELAWYAEHDPVPEHGQAPARVMAAHHPGVPNVGDITEAQFSACEPVDVLAAGFPCTSVSVAGQRRGSDDERWLWPDVARAVRVLRPSVFVGENVPGLLTIERGQLFGQVIADLDDLGYSVRWITVGACRVGLCHHRHRVFILATLGEVEPAGVWPVARRVGGGWETADDTLFGAGLYPKWPAAGIAAKGRVWSEPCWPCGADGIVLPTPTVAERTNRSPSPGAAVRPPLSRVVQMLPTPGARLGDDRGAPDAELAAARLDAGRRNLDDAVALLPTPTAAEATGASPKVGSSREGGPDLRTVVASLLPTPSARDHKGPDARGDRSDGAERSPAQWQLPRVVESLLPTPRSSDGEKGGPNQRGSSGDLGLPAAVQPGRFGPYEAAVRRHELVAGVPAPEPTELGTKGQARLDPRFPEWMLTLPAGWVTNHLPRRAALRVIGNGIATLGGAYALRVLAEGLPITGEHLEVG